MTKEDLNLLSDTAVEDALDTSNPNEKALYLAIADACAELVRRKGNK